MNKMGMTKERLLQELLDDMDDHESMKLAPKKEVSVMAIGSPEKDDSNEKENDQDSGIGSSDDDESDDEDLRKLLEEYTRG